MHGNHIGHRDQRGPKRRRYFEGTPSSSPRFELQSSRFFACVRVTTCPALKALLMLPAENLQHPAIAILVTTSY